VKAKKKSVFVFLYGVLTSRPCFN